MIRAEPSIDQTVTVLIVTHVRLYREGLVGILSTRDSLNVVGAAQDYETAVAQAIAAVPDVVLIDMSTPQALEIVKALRHDLVATKLVAFGVREEGSQIVICLEAGADGYVTCDSTIDNVIATVASVARGELPCSPRIAATFARRLASRAAAANPSVSDESLTSRERQVLRLIEDGLSNKEIARALNIAVATVKNHVHHLLEKLEVTTRNKAVKVTRVTPISEASRSIAAGRGR